MQINLNKNFGVSEKLTTVGSKGGVVTGNIRTTKEMIDMNGNVIDPRTKQIIKKNVEEKLIMPK